MINIIVVTHGEFGAYLIEAAEAIVGRQAEGVLSISISSRLPVNEVRERLTGAVSELRGGGLVIATDMPGGTPCNLVMPIVKDMDDVCIVSGVNLYMLVAAFNARRTAKLEDLAQNMLAAGRRAIADVKSMFLMKA